MRYNGLTESELLILLHRVCWVEMGDGMNNDWQPISSAPQDGRTIRVRRVVDGRAMFERQAAWRTVTFPAFVNGIHGVEPEYTATGWMYPDQDKRVPEPTHWLPDHA